MGNRLKKGQLVFFTDEKLPYTVKAVSARYAVVVRPLDTVEDDHLLEFEVEMDAYSSKEEAYDSLKDSPVYSLLDVVKNIRSTNDLVFDPYDYFKDEDCQSCLSDLEDEMIGLSRRNATGFSIDENRMTYA